MYAFFQFLRLGTELIGRELLDAFVSFLYFLYPWLYLTHVACILIAKQFANKFVKSHIFVLVYIYLYFFTQQ